MKKLLAAFALLLWACPQEAPAGVASRVCAPNIGCITGDGTDYFVDSDGDGVLDPTELNLTINAPTATGNQTVQGDLSVVGSVSGAIAGGDAVMFDYCRSGGKGVGKVVANDGYGVPVETYAATCGNYPWSAESGGVAGGVGDYDAPTTSGGNALDLECSAPGVGVASGVTYNSATALLSADVESAGASSLTETDTTLVANAWRDQVITMTSGSCSGAQGLVVSNTTSVFTLAEAWDTGDACAGAPTAPSAGDTYTVRDPLGSVCHQAGERVRVNIMADLMLAQDHTRPGGRVYMPTFAGKDHGIYVDRGCGRKGHGPSGTTFNGCPVLRYPRDSQTVRDIATMSGIRIMWDGTDYDGWANGRKGVWRIDDQGSGAADTTRIGIEPSNGEDIIRWPFKAGGDSLPANRCYANALGFCQPASNPEHALTLARAGRIWAAFNNAEVTSPGSFCADNRDSTTGVCQDDPRIVCTADANCDFSAGGAGNRGNLGPCESNWEFFQSEVARGRGWIHITGGNLAHPETGVGSGEQENTVARLSEVTASACNTNGRLFGTRGWPLASSVYPVPVGTESYTSIDEGAFWQVGGGHDGGTHSPNNWYGRDCDGSGTSNDSCDCLSAGDEDFADDEVSCDSAHLLAHHAGWGAGLYNLLTVNGGSDTFLWDGNTASYRGRASNLTIKDGKRGALCDQSSLDADRVSFVNNNSLSGIATLCTVGFTGPMTTLRGWHFQGNRALGALLGFSGVSGHVFAENFDFIDNAIGQAAVRIDTATNLSLTNFRLYGTRGLNADVGGGAAVFWPPTAEGGVHNVRIEHWRLRGVGNFMRDVFGKAAFVFSREFQSYNAPITGVIINDVKWDSPDNNTCLVYFDNDTGDGQMEKNAANVRIQNSDLTATNGATGQKVICLDDLTTNPSDASHDDGILTNRWIPSWTNLTQNGAPLPDQPYPVGPVASCGDADDPGMRGRVCHVHDGTATCDETGGVLQSGTARAICRVGDATDDWVNF